MRCCAISGKLDGERDTAKILQKQAEMRIGRQQPGKVKVASQAYGKTSRLEGGPRQYLNFRLDILSSEAMKAADDIYRRECGLTVRELRILRLVGHHPGITSSQLANEAQLERGLTSRIVTALVSRDLLERHVDAADARQYHLHLTKQGEAVRNDAAGLADRLEGLLLTPLTAEERRSLFDCLDKLTAWVRQGGGLETLASPRKRRTAASEHEPILR